MTGFNKIIAFSRFERKLRILLLCYCVCLYACTYCITHDCILIAFAIIMIIAIKTSPTVCKNTAVKSNVQL